MREIKFRAWDKKEKYMFVPHCGTDDINKEIKEAQEMYELMQYTGLKDKNGKEIYEGDIVSFVGGSINFLKCGYYSGDVHQIGKKLVVVGLNSGFTLCETPEELLPSVVGNVGNYDFWNYQISFEIIGNIYENAELIEKESV